MPFVSEKQRRYLYSQKPAVANKFAEHGKKYGGSNMEGMKKYRTNPHGVAADYAGGEKPKSKTTSGRINELLNAHDCRDIFRPTRTQTFRSEGIKHTLETPKTPPGAHNPGKNKVKI